MSKKFVNSISWTKEYVQETLLDSAHAFQVAKLALNILSELEQWFLFQSQDKFYLELAALLHDSGLNIANKSHHKLSLEYILNLDMPLSDNDKLLMANISRYHRKSWPQNKHGYFLDLNPNQKATVLRLSPILRIADGLDKGHNQAVQKVKLEKVKDGIGFCLITDGQDLTLDLGGFNKKKDFFEYSYQAVMII